MPPGHVGIVPWFGMSGREWRLASASAVLLFAAFPPFHMLAPSFLALVPLAVMAGSARNPNRAARGGFVFGVLHYGLLLHWMVPALLRTTAAAVLVYAIAVLLLALSQALVCWVLHRLRRGAGISLWLALPLAWTAGEWLAVHLPGTLAYPWLGLGTSLTGYPELVGVAELVGARGVTLWLALVNGLLAEAVVRRAWRGRWLWAAVAVTAAPAAWGVGRAGHLELRPGPVVAAARTTLRAQPGDGMADLDALRAVDSLLAGVAGRGPAPSLVVLPEGTFRDGLDQPDVVAGVRALSRRMAAPVLFGVARAAGRGAGRYNSAVLAGPDGLLGDPYDKRHLVPWVERMPLEELFPAAGQPDSYRAGDEWTVLRAGAHPVGVLICYEAAFAGAARALRRAGARVLVNLTNDAWFARAGAFAGAQHEAHLVMRAIETRTGVVRSANLGAAGFIDPAGRTHTRTTGPGAAIVTARVDAVREDTWFVRLGDVAGPGAAAAVLLLILAPVFTRRASPEPESLSPP